MANQTDTPESLFVRSEDEAWALIQKIAAGDLTVSDYRALRLVGWPRMSLFVPGERLDAALTPYMMSGFVELQRVVFRSYALVVHHEASGRLLSDVEKDRLELIVQVGAGSSSSEIDLTEIVSQIGADVVAKMEPTHIVVLILGLGLLWAGKSTLCAWLDKKKDEKLAETQSKQIKESLEAVKFSQQADLERMKIFAQAISHTPVMEPLQDEADDAKQALTRHISKTDSALINGVRIDGALADRLTRGTRSESIEVRLDGAYRIQKVDATAPDGFKVRLEDIDSGQEFDAGVQDEIISHEQKEILMDAEWRKQPVHAKINARKRRNEIIEAVVIDARVFDDEGQ